MSKSFMSRKMRLPRQHPQPDLVEPDRVAEGPRQLQPLQRVGHVHGDDQAVIGGGLGHGDIPLMDTPMQVPAGPAKVKPERICRSRAT
jgi:hypothetical protein